MDEFTQRNIEKLRENVAKYNDILAMQQEGTELEALHPDLDDEELREYSEDLATCAVRWPWIGQTLEDE